MYMGRVLNTNLNAGSAGQFSTANNSGSVRFDRMRDCPSCSCPASEFGATPPSVPYLTHWERAPNPYLLIVGVHTTISISLTHQNRTVRPSETFHRNRPGIPRVPQQQPLLLRGCVL